MTLGKKNAFQFIRQLIMNLQNIYKTSTHITREFQFTTFWEDSGKGVVC